MSGRRKSAAPCTVHVEEEREASTRRDKEASKKRDQETSKKRDQEARKKPDQEASEKPDQEASEKLDQEDREKPDQEACKKPDQEASEKLDQEVREKPDQEASEKPDQEASEKPDQQANETRDQEMSKKPDQEMSEKQDLEMSEKEHQERIPADTQEKDLDTATASHLSEKEASKSSESDEKSAQSRQDAAAVSEKEKQNGDMTPSEEEEEEGEKENQCPDVIRNCTKDYRCKYCAFTTLNLGDFKDHVDSNHPDVILNPLYLCVACNFRTKKFDSLTEHNEQQHPSDANFRFKKTCVDNQTVLEQTLDANEEETTANEEEVPGNNSSCITPTVTSSNLLPNSGGRLENIRALSINGTVIIPEANVLQDTSHVSPMLQRPPNFSSVPQIAVPLNTTKYNPSLDNNVTLIASFNKFPYPTHAELSWLTAASKHPEEQIRVWFTTQRLKQGITWSPEEVEEARKKMFNGSIPVMQNSLTVLSTSPVSKAMVHTTTVGPQKHGGSFNCPPNALKRSITTTSFGPDPKRPIMAVAPNPGEKGLMAPPPLPLKPTLDAKRVNANDIKRTIVPLMQPALTLQKNKLVPNIPNNSKTRPFMSMPSMVFPESLTRPMIAPAPFYSPPFKNNLLVPKANEKVPVSLPNGTLPTSVPLVPPQIRRPAVIQTIRGNVSAFNTLDPTQMNEQNTEAIKTSYNGKWTEQSFHSNGHPDDPKNDFQQKAQVLTQFPLLERMKGKTSEQLKVLEENFLRNSFPTLSDVETLASSTGLSPAEIDSWFSERRALRDNLEQALLNSMGNKRNGSSGHSPNGPNGHNGNINGLNVPNGPSVLNRLNISMANGHSLNGHTPNGHAPNGYAPNGHAPNGYAPNGHAPNGHSQVEKSLQNGVLKVGAHVALPVSRGSEEFASRWSFVDNMHWFNSDMNGKPGGVMSSSELIGPRFHDSTNGSNSRVQEAEPNWLKKSQPSHDRYNRLDLGAMFGRWIDRRQDLSEES